MVVRLFGTVTHVKVTFAKSLIVTFITYRKNVTNGADYATFADALERLAITFPEKGALELSFIVSALFGPLAPSEQAAIHQYLSVFIKHGVPGKK